MRWLLWCFCLLAESYETINHWPKCFFADWFLAYTHRGKYILAGAEPDIFIWGAAGGASFATRGAVNGLCRTFRKRPEKFWGAVALPGTPLAPPLHTWIEICASLNHRIKTKAYGSWLIPRKHTETLVLLSVRLYQLHCTTIWSGVIFHILLSMGSNQCKYPIEDFEQ